MRDWSRSACLFGSPALEDSIRRELDRQFPPDRFHVNIEVVGGQNNAFATVWVSNLDHGINVSEKANPEVFGLDTLAAVIQATKNLMAELEQSGRFPNA
jgi:hypothetical protein